MDFGNFISLLGGVAMFLFGMSVMGDSLKKVAGSRMELILYSLSGNTLKGILLGTAVTAVIQSSSATSVMVVGFVNSGMMKVRQAIGVVLGAILGTSVTGWILCLNSVSGSGSTISSLFSTEILTGIVALAGIGLWMFASRASFKNIGGIMLGFAVLMYGMSMMSGSIEPLREDARFIHLLLSFTHPVLGVLAGLVITAVIQSASAAVGILQALAVTGAIEFDMAFPILMGIGIGASVPVMLSALGASTNGKRSAFVYLIIDILGAVLCGIIFYSLNAVFEFSIMTKTMTMVSIALSNALYRLATVIMLAPCTGILEKIVCALFPESEEAAAERADMDRLEQRFIEHPALAITQSSSVINSMAAKALDGVISAVNARRGKDKAIIKKVYDLEDVLDRYEDKLGSYLFKITSAQLKDDQVRDVNKYLRVLSDFERISDHAKNIGEATEEIIEKKLQFSKRAEHELSVLEDAVIDIMQVTLDAFVNNDMEKAILIDPLEEVIDDICDIVKANHTDRVSKQKCTIQNGFVFNDLITDYERISDHCSNVGIDIIESIRGELYAHEYHMNIDYRNDWKYRELFNYYKIKYADELR